MAQHSFRFHKFSSVFSWLGCLLAGVVAIGFVSGAARAECTLSGGTTLPTSIPNDVWTGLPIPNALSRQEREFKFAVRGTALQAPVGTSAAVTARALAGLLAERLEQAVGDPTLWKAPALLRSDYSLGRIQQGMVVPEVDDDGFLDF